MKFTNIIASSTVEVSDLYPREEDRCTGRIFHIHWTDFVSNDVVRSRTGQPLLSDTIRQRRMFFFGHLCRADIGQDHSRALQVCIRGPPKYWRAPSGYEELLDRGKPGWERLRTIWARSSSTSAWRRQDGALWIDRHGVYSWMRLYVLVTCTLPRDREIASYANAL